MSRKSLPSGLTRGWNRLCEKDMRNQRTQSGMTLEEKSSCSRLLARYIRLFCIEKTFGLHGEMHPVLKARVLCFAQEIDVVGDGPAQSLDPWPLVLGKVAEHVSVHEILHPGMADPDA